MNYLSIFVAFCALFNLACQQELQKNLIQNLDLASNSEQKLLVSGVDNPDLLRQQASQIGVRVSGTSILILEGKGLDLKQLTIPATDEVELLVDEPMALVKENDKIQINDRALYLAKKEFGLISFREQYPTYDGRGVIAGVIDDGASPLASGLQTTTTGERKFIAKKTTSNLLALRLRALPQDRPGKRFRKSRRYKSARSVDFKYDRVWQGRIEEAALKPYSWDGIGYLDLNANEEQDIFQLAVYQMGRRYRVCIDTSMDKTYTEEECFFTYGQSGEYGFWTEDQLVAITAEFNPQEATLTLTQGERKGDSHGEGVASVLLGHQIAGRFDGVAPGAKLIDYDFSEENLNREEALYSMAKFIRALEYLGDNGARVANISYSLYFQSVEAQEFMKKALEKIVKEHNIVISFSAGNNGPGLGSLNRRGIYPDNALVAGAYVSKELDEHVHGVSGLPEEGRVVWYSSRGLGPYHGNGPVVISPLASLAHSTPGDGFRAFSGTSSAAPALAGLAATLISAAEQEGLAHDASAIVHAIRLSAQPLPGISFADQGYGLPHAGRALEIYRKLVSGELFASVNAKVLRAQSVNGKDAKGLYLYANGRKSLEHRIEISGNLAQSLADARRNDALRLLRIEYSDDFIMGAQRLWISSASAYFSIGIDLTNIDIQNEQHAEIRLIDDEANLLLHKIPVTIVNRPALNSKLEWQVPLGAEEGTRVHFQVPQGAQGYATRAMTLGAHNAYYYAIPYSQSNTKTQGVLQYRVNSEFFVSTPRAGTYQLGLARSKGTALEGGIVLEVEPLFFQLGTRATSRSKPAALIYNGGESRLVKIKTEKAQTLVAEGIHSFNQENRELQKEVQIDAAGTYSFSMESLEDSNYDYLVYYCAIEVYDSEGNVSRRSMGRNTKVREIIEEKVTSDASEIGGKIRFYCKSFDQISEDVFAVALGYKIKFKEKSSLLDQRIYSLEKGANRLELVNLNLDESLEKLDLKVLPLQGSGEISLGEIEIY